MAAGVHFERARGRGHTKREAMRIVKRHLYNIVHRTMLRDTLRNGLYAFKWGVDARVA